MSTLRCQADIEPFYLMLIIIHNTCSIAIAYCAGKLLDCLHLFTYISINYKYIVIFFDGGIEIFFPPPFDPKKFGWRWGCQNLF